MASDIPGPDNGIALKATTLTFAVVSTLLAMWRFTYRAKRKLLSWSDAFLLVGLVSKLREKNTEPLISRADIIYSVLRCLRLESM